MTRRQLARERRAWNRHRRLDPVGKTMERWADLDEPPGMRSREERRARVKAEMRGMLRAEIAHTVITHDPATDSFASYQWMRWHPSHGWRPIPGATGREYFPTEEDV
jgi:hypothetical protein